MPKLIATLATKADKEKDKWGDRTPLDNGFYLFKLLKVEAKDGTAAAQWIWTWEELHTTKRVFDSTSLSEKAIGRLGKVFEAFGVPADTDTDLLVGKVLALRISQRTIQEGEKKGQIVNNVDSWHPPTEHDEFANIDVPAGLDLAGSAAKGDDDLLD